MSIVKNIGLSTAAILAVSGVVKKAIKQKVNLRGAAVLITGSRGLGLALAHELGRRGARFWLYVRAIRRNYGEPVTSSPGKV